MDAKIEVSCDMSPVLAYFELFRNRYGSVLSESHLDARLVRIERTEFVNDGTGSIGMIAYPSDEFMMLAAEIAAKENGVGRWRRLWRWATRWLA